LHHAVLDAEVEDRLFGIDRPIDHEFLEAQVEVAILA
jgi:hypothetical protein